MESVLAFGEGAFPGKEIFIQTPIENDTLLRPYKFCDKYVKMIENPESVTESHLFERTPDVKSVLSRINSKLGFGEAQMPRSSVANSNESPLEFEEISLIYKLCQYEQQSQTHRNFDQIRVSTNPLAFYLCHFNATLAIATYSCVKESSLKMRQ